MSDRRRSPDSSRRHRNRSRSPKRHSRSPKRSSRSSHRNHSSSSRRHRSVSSSPESTRRHRHRSVSSSPESRHGRRHRSISSSPDSRRRHRHSKKRSRSSSSDSDRRKRKDKKHKKKKDKKKKKKSKLSSIGDQYGKYGIIHEADIFTKEAEFQAWLIEVKGENVEILNNNRRKEMFIDFMEDYNTATMPDEKFYDIAKYEKRQQSIRMGDPLPVTTDSFDFHNDEERLRAQHRQAARMAASRQPTLTLSEEQIKELTRVNRERVEADRMRKMGLKPKESMGVRYEEE